MAGRCYDGSTAIENGLLYWLARLRQHESVEGVRCDGCWGSDTILGLSADDAKLADRSVDRYSSADRNGENIDMFPSGITILKHRSVKGQELDSVLIVQLDELMPCAGASDRHSMYMLCSRTRDFLCLVHGSSALSAVAERALPPPHALERA